MSLAQFQGDGPVASQVRVRPIEEPKPRRHQRRPAPRRSLRQGVVREREPGGGEVEQRQKHGPDRDDAEQRAFQIIHLPVSAGIADRRAPHEDVTNAEVNNQPGEKDEVPRLHRRSLASFDCAAADHSAAVAPPALPHLGQYFPVRGLPQRPHRPPSRLHNASAFSVASARIRDASPPASLTMRATFARDDRRTKNAIVISQETAVNATIMTIPAAPPSSIRRGYCEQTPRIAATPTAAS